MSNGPQSFKNLFTVSRETISKLETYAEVLTQWQKVVQLVAPSTLPHLWHRHFADSAQILQYTPQYVERWIDVGSGGGFPGLVVALLAQDPNFNCQIQRFILVESDTRKAAFLREVSRHLGLAVDIFSGRIESATTQANVGKGDVISARALAPLGELLTFICPYWKSTTLGLFLKGQEVNDEITKAFQIFTFELEIKPSVTDPRGQIVIIKDLKFKREG